MYIYFSLNGVVIPNNGYVMISDIGPTDDTALLCHTNHPDIMGDTDGMHSGGQSFAPDGIIEVIHYGNFSRLFRNRASSSQSTFTCISTYGPPTIVTWTRDNVTITEGTETVLNVLETAQYTHTLTVTGRLGGLYTCAVANNKPSSNSTQYYVRGMWVSLSYYVCHYTNSSVVFEIFEAVAGQRQVNFSWSPALATRNNTLITLPPSLPHTSRINHCDKLQSRYCLLMFSSSQ